MYCTKIRNKPYLISKGYSKDFATKNTAKFNWE